MIEPSSAEVAYRVAIAPVLQRNFGFGIKFAACLEWIYVNEAFSFAAQALKNGSVNRLSHIITIASLSGNLL